MFEIDLFSIDQSIAVVQTNVSNKLHHSQSAKSDAAPHDVFATVTDKLALYTFEVLQYFGGTGAEQNSCWCSLWTVCCSPEFPNCSVCFESSSPKNGETGHREARPLTPPPPPPGPSLENILSQFVLSPQTQCFLQCFQFTVHTLKHQHIIRSQSVNHQQKRSITFLIPRSPHRVSTLCTHVNIVCRFYSLSLSQLCWIEGWPRLCSVLQVLQRPTVTTLNTLDVAVSIF